MRVQQEQQIAADGVEACPQPRIDAPFPAVGGIELFPALAIEAQGCGLDITKLTGLAGQVAVATEGDLLSVDGNDPVEHEVAGQYLSQHHVAHTGGTGSYEERLVALVFQEGTHAAAS